MVLNQSSTACCRFLHHTFHTCRHHVQWTMTRMFKLQLLGQIWLMKVWYPAGGAPCRSENMALREQWQLILQPLPCCPIPKPCAAGSMLGHLPCPQSSTAGLDWGQVVHPVPTMARSGLAHAFHSLWTNQAPPCLPHMLAWAHQPYQTCEPKGHCQSCPWSKKVDYEVSVPALDSYPLGEIPGRKYLYLSGQLCH